MKQKSFKINPISLFTYSATKKTKARANRETEVTTNGATTTTSLACN